MRRSKPSGGRPKHEAVYESGQKAQDNFLAAMRTVLNPPKSAKTTRRSGRSSGK